MVPVLQVVCAVCLVFFGLAVIAWIVSRIINKR